MSSTRYVARANAAIALHLLKASTAHKVFHTSLHGKWNIDKRGQVSPHSVCWLFVWAANKDPKWQKNAVKLRAAFSEILPFTFDEFNDKIGRENAKSLEKIKNEDDVQAQLERHLGSPSLRLVDVSREIESLLCDASTRLRDERYFEEDERKRVLREVIQRRGQPEFRSLLLTAYDQKCAMTGCDAIDALEAAHIIPVGDFGSDDVSNGLLLRADIYTLFDLQLLGIDPESRRITLHNKLLLTSYGELHACELAVPKKRELLPNSEALKHRWKEFLHRAYSSL